MSFRKSTALPGTGQLFTQIPQRIHLSGSMYGFFWKIFRALASFVQTLFRTFVRSTLKLGLPYFSINASIEITLQTTSIPGKGRISQATRDRVRAFIKEHDYRPNVVAKGLAQRKTYNIALLMPKDSPQLPQPQYFLPCNFPVPSSPHGNW